MFEEHHCIIVEVGWFVLGTFPRGPLLKELVYNAPSSFGWQ